MICVAMESPSKRRDNLLLTLENRAAHYSSALVVERSSVMKAL